jgi:hypothetical protein
MGMKCWNSTFNAQGSRIIIVHVHVRILKIYVAIMEKLRGKERGGQNQCCYGINKMLSINLSM